MAKQGGPIYLKGTIDDITFYEMGGEHYARKKTSLNKKRFYKDPAFAGSRKSANLFGVASKLASKVHRSLPKEQRKKGVISKLTGMVGRLLREGKTTEEILLLFQPSTTYVSSVINSTATTSPQQKKIARKKNSRSISVRKASANNSPGNQKTNNDSNPNDRQKKTVSTRRCTPCLFHGTLYSMLNSRSELKRVNHALTEEPPILKRVLPFY